MEFGSLQWLSANGFARMGSRIRSIRGSKVGRHTATTLHSQSKQSQGFSAILKGNAENFFYRNLSGKGYNFEALIEATQNHFETEQGRQAFFSVWSAMDLNKAPLSHPEKSKMHCLDRVIAKLRLIQPVLRYECQFKLSSRDQLLNAHREVLQCNIACFIPTTTFEGLCFQL